MQTSSQTPDSQSSDQKTGLSQEEVAGRLNQDHKPSTSLNDLSSDAVLDTTITPSTNSNDSEENVCVAGEQQPKDTVDGGGILEEIEEEDLEFASQDEINKLLRDMKVLDENVAAPEPTSAYKGEQGQRRQSADDEQAYRDDRVGSDHSEGMPEAPDKEAGAMSQDDINDLIEEHREDVGDAQILPTKAEATAENSNDKLDQGLSEAGKALPANDTSAKAERQAPSEAGPEDEAVLISQEDLDRLLQNATITDDDSEGNSSDEEASIDEADAPSPETQADLSPSMQAPENSSSSMAQQQAEFISQADLDQLLAGEQPPGSEAGQAAAEPETVILEVDDQEEETAAAATLTEARTDAPVRSRGGSRKLWVITAACLVIISLPLAWLAIGRLKHRFPLPAAVQSFPIQQAAQSQYGGQRQAFAAGAAIEMPGFIVLAPLERMDASFIAADVTLRFADAQSGKDIRRHYPFFRSLVYEVLKSSLVDSAKDQIDPVKLQVAIKKVFSKTLPVDAMRSLKQIEIHNLTVG